MANSVQVSRLVSLKMPFSFSALANSKLKKPLKTSEAKLHMGVTLFPRLNNISVNLMEAIATGNDKYLADFCSKELYEAIQARKRQLQTSQLRLKMQKSILPKGSQEQVQFSGKMRKILKINFPSLYHESTIQNVSQSPTTTTIDGNKLSISTAVFFGARQDSKPLSKGHSSAEQSDRVVRIGVNRYLCFPKDSNLSFLDKISPSRLAKNYCVHFKLCFTSPRYIGVFTKESKLIEQPQSIPVVTHIDLWSTGGSYNWVVTDINGLVGKK